MSDVNFTLVDTTGLGEGIRAIIDLVKPYVDGHAAAFATRKKADAERYVRRTEIEDAADQAEVRARASYRIMRIEERRQRNLESIVGKALVVAPSAQPQGRADDDWAASFFDSCKDVGNDEMQTIWARILAGEVEHPGTFSLRTLQVVRTMSRHDAELFTKAVALSWSSGEIRFVFWSDTIPIGLYASRGFDYGAVLHLDALGLVGPHSHLAEPNGVEIAYGGKRWTLFDPDYGGASRAMFPFTAVGCELATIAGGVPDPEFLHEVIECFRLHKVEVRENKGDTGTATERT